MKRLFLLTIMVGIGAGLELWQTIQTDPLTVPGATVAFPIWSGLTLAALIVLLRIIWYTPDKTTTLPGFVFWRQGLLGGLTFGVLLYLQGLHVITLLDALLLIVAAILLEMFLAADKFDPTTTRRA